MVEAWHILHATTSLGSWGYTIFYAHRRFLLIWSSLVVAGSLWLCFVPLFNLLAFEFALAISAPCVIGAGLWGIRIRGGTPLARSTVRHALGGAALPLSMSLTIISLNALRVQNCDYTEGLVLFFLFTVVNTLIGLLWGLALGRFQRARSLWFLCFIGSIALAVWRFYTDPPVDIFHHFLGYYPGALYDDVFLIDDRILWSRAEDLAIACLALFASNVYPIEKQPSKRWMFASIGMMVGSLLLHRVAVDHDVYRNAEYVQKALGGRISSDSISLYYPKRWTQEYANDLFTDLEFSYQELATFFKVKPQTPILVYAYKNADQKKRLMGARRTRIAKPWQWAFHVDAPHIGQAVIIHEMAHIFAGAIAHGPHHISLNRWGLPNMGIIEGVAEAATWDSGQLNLHQWTAALTRLGLAPPLATLVRPDGFYAQHARTAYTMCGSLTRYIIEKHGQSSLPNIYRAGDFSEPLNVSFEQLATEWRAFLETQQVPTLALAATKARYDRPSIFGKVCAREIAALRRTASTRFRNRKWKASASVNRDILRHIPDDIGARLQTMRAQVLMGDIDAAQVTAMSLSGDRRAGAVARHKADETLADLAALRGDVAEAESGYRGLLPHAFARHRQRTLTVKLSAVKQKSIRAEVIRYLTGSWPRQQRQRLTTQIIETAPNWAIGRYLHARTLISTDDWQRGVKDLNQIAPLLESESLKLEAWQLMARTLFTNKCYKQSARIYGFLARYTDIKIYQGERDYFERWSRRTIFFGQKNAGTDAQCRAVIDIALPDKEYPPKLGNTPSIE